MILQNSTFLKTLTVEDILNFYETQLEAIEYVSGKDSAEYAEIITEQARFFTVLKDIDLLIEETKTYSGDFANMYLGHGGN